MKELLILTSLLICSLFQKGLAIKCVSCSSVIESFCGLTYTGQTDTASLVDCGSDTKDCLKLTASGRNITRRLCSNDAVLFGCKVTPHEFCDICDDKDGCNDSDTFRITVVPVWLVLVLAAI